MPLETVDDFADLFGEEPGYLDFARVGPVGQGVLEEERAFLELLRRSRFGSLDALDAQDGRMRRAVAALTGFRQEQVVFQPDGGAGFLHSIFGLADGVLVEPGTFPGSTFAGTAVVEAPDAWSPSGRDGITPGLLRAQLDPAETAVAVRLVDSRSGHLADLDGIRQVIGDRLLVVDAGEGFGVVDAPYEAADVVVSGGHAWARAGWGTGFLALSDRALELLPALAGVPGSAAETPTGVAIPSAADVSAFGVAHPDPLAQARFATALEEIAAVGVGPIAARVAERVTMIIDVADEFAVPVVSSRSEDGRGGIVVLEPAPEHLTWLVASLHNHGITATTRVGRVHLSAHVSTTSETLEMVRGAFTSFGTAITL